MSLLREQLATWRTTTHDPRMAGVPDPFGPVRIRCLNLGLGVAGDVLAPLSSAGTDRSMSSCRTLRHCSSRMRVMYATRGRLAPKR